MPSTHVCHVLAPSPGDNADCPEQRRVQRGRAGGRGGAGGGAARPLVPRASNAQGAAALAPASGRLWDETPIPATPRFLAAEAPAGVDAAGHVPCTAVTTNDCLPVKHLEGCPAGGPLINICCLCRKGWSQNSEAADPTCFPLC